jgi:nucleotide-binding universal stress UspA family protein
MTVRSGPGEQTPRAGIATEVIEMWTQLTGPEGNDLSRTARIIAGIAPAAACYVMPSWARDRGATGVPPWWTWPAKSWLPGDRRQELLLAAALALAAVEQTPTHGQPPPLTVVRDADETTRPASAGHRRGSRDRILAAVEQARADLVDHEGLDPARSLRPSGLESLMLATACHLLPAEMREIGRAGVPQMWAWPTTSWMDIQDRATELTIAAAMAQAVIELHDRTEKLRGRTSTLAIIDGQAPSR